MKRLVTLFSVLFFLFISCNGKNNRKEPDFFYAKTLEWDFALNDPNVGIVHYKREVIIIRNSDDYSIDELLVFIEKYEKNHKFVDTSYLFDRYDDFERCYYRESKKTPINFVEDPGGFVVDVLEDHHEDYVCCRRIRKIERMDEKIIERSNDCN